MGKWVLSLILLVSTACLGADYYVLQAGAGGGTGADWANAAAYSTIQAGGSYWAAAAAGDVVHIGDACTGDLLLNNLNFTGGDPITFRGDTGGGGVPTITSGTTAAVYLLSGGTVTGGFVFDGLTVVGSTGDYGFWLRDNSTACSTVTIQNCTVTSDTGGIIMTGDNDGITLTDNTVTVTGGTTKAIGMLTDGAAACDVTISGGIYASAATSLVGTINCTNNTTLVITGATITDGYRGINVTDAVGVDIENCTISGCRDKGISVMDADGSSVTGNVKIIGNTISSVVERGLYVYRCLAADVIRVENNTISTVSGSGYGMEVEGYGAGTTSQKGVFVRNNQVSTSVSTASCIIVKDCDYCVVSGNTAYAQTAGLGIYFKGSKNCLCINNSIGRGSAGIEMGVEPDWGGPSAGNRNCAGIIIENNAIIATYPVHAGDASQLYEADYNCYDSNAETHGVDGDPLFFDAANLDFRLLPISPCFNAGRPSVNSGYTTIGAWQRINRLRGF